METAGRALDGTKTGDAGGLKRCRIPMLHGASLCTIDGVGDHPTSSTCRDLSQLPRTWLREIDTLAIGSDSKEMILALHGLHSLRLHTTHPNHQTQNGTDENASLAEGLRGSSFEAMKCEMKTKACSRPYSSRPHHGDVPQKT